MIAFDAAALSGDRTVRSTARLTGLARDRINRASIVRKFAPDLADNVALGVIPLDEAYKTAQERK